MLFFGYYLFDFRFAVSIWSFNGVFFLSGVMLIAALVNKSALSLPWIPIWFGIQQNIIFLLWIIMLSLFRILTISGFSNLVYLSDWRTEMESEWMINFLELLGEIRSSARVQKSSSSSWPIDRTLSGTTTQG